jgi:hypothetical protein
MIQPSRFWGTPMSRILRRSIWPFINIPQVPVFLASFARKSKESAKTRTREAFDPGIHSEFSSSRLPSRFRARLEI